MVYETDYFSKNEPAELDADMTPSDLLFVLGRLKFRNDWQVIRIDAPVRDYLVAALVARHGKT